MDLSWRLKRIEEALGINDSWSEPSPAEIARSQELSALESNPNTPNEIANLAAKLIERFPNEAIPVVVAVTVPARRAKNQVHGLAEAFRIWPVGEFDIASNDGSDQRCLVGVGDDGRLMRADGALTPTLPFDRDMRWVDPPTVSITRQYFRAHVLEALRADSVYLDRRPAETPQALATAGRGYTAAEQQRVGGLLNKAYNLRQQIREVQGRYGTALEPTQHGVPSRDALAGWKRVAIWGRDLDKIDAKLDRLGYAGRRTWREPRQ